jgi:three-Cys-motif partner protein
MNEVESLFDSDGYLQVPDPGDAEATTPELAALAKLDSDKTLVNGSDDRPARQVHIHSLDKAHIARYYADIVGKGMRRAYGGPLAWVELFAGPGMLRVKELNAFKPGSPIEAVTIDSPFTHYVFSDADPRCVKALQARLDEIEVAATVHPVIEGDANSAAVHDAIVEAVPRNSLLVLYADPAALDFNFSTIEFFAERYEHLDLLINLPVPGFVRALRAGHQGKASSVLNHPAPAVLIGPTSGRPGISLRDYFERQLRALRYEHFESEVVREYQKNVAVYDLMIASRSEKATQFFREALLRGRDGQTRLDLF